MRKLFIITVAILALGIGASFAFATGPITRKGADASGIANPGGCEVRSENTAVGLGELHVKCTKAVGATKAARIRYRFLKDVGGKRGPATVSADIHQIAGKDCTVSWRGPIRTLRVVVPFGSYCHIRSVTWYQKLNPGH